MKANTFDRYIMSHLTRIPTARTKRGSFPYRAFKMLRAEVLSDIGIAVPSGSWLSYRSNRMKSIRVPTSGIAAQGGYVERHLGEEVAIYQRGTYGTCCRRESICSFGNARRSLYTSIDQ